MSADLEKLLAEATPGPWRVLPGKFCEQIHSAKHWIANIKCESCPAHEDANAHLIAMAPDLARQVIALTAENAALRAKAEKLAEAVRHERELACQDIGMQIEASNAVEAALTEWGTP